MLTVEGCKARRGRLLERLNPPSALVLSDPIALRYLAGFSSEPVSHGADFGGLLLLNPDGSTELFVDGRVAKWATAAAHADKVTVLPWYDGVQSEPRPRRLLLQPQVQKLGGRLNDSLADPLAEQFWTILDDLRRAKDSDEVATLKAACAAGAAGQRWALENARPGMSELAVYGGIVRACSEAAGQMVVVYGDFTVSTGSKKRGGPPTPHILVAGETLILDFSVVLNGYRSDFTNTIVIGGSPSDGQKRLLDVCLAAMFAAEQLLKPGSSCREVDSATRAMFRAEHLEASFLHHTGHGLGCGHPEAPFFVRESTETLRTGDVVTLEPGLYVDGIGGVRIEHNYVITPTGFERLSHHELRLV
ncbi:MAG: M24 family metallopeptidase [Gemmataceae bacterium]